MLENSGSLIGEWPCWREPKTNLKVCSARVPGMAPLALIATIWNSIRGGIWKLTQGHYRRMSNGALTDGQRIQSEHGDTVDGECHFQVFVGTESEKCLEESSRC